MPAMRHRDWESHTRIIFSPGAPSLSYQYRLFLHDAALHSCFLIPPARNLHKRVTGAHLLHVANSQTTLGSGTQKGKLASGTVPNTH